MINNNMTVNRPVVDVLIGVQYGDEGKGKISKALIEEHRYNAVCKFSGGANAGHAVWINDTKYTAHHLTSGIYDENCDILIGRGCVVHPKAFLEEVETFSKFCVKGRTFIHPSTHIVTDKHIQQESSESKIGTTRRGIGPCTADKYKRTGVLAKDVPELKEFVFDFDSKFAEYKRVLMEGSQGWGLDIEHGKYPYVTSSHMHPAHAFTSFGIPLKWLGTVYGVGKVYVTYVGADKNMVFAPAAQADRLREIGKEYGETTGRARDVGYLDLDQLTEACNRTGVDVLFLNKMDILEEASIFNVAHTDHNSIGEITRVIKSLSDSPRFNKFVKEHIYHYTNVKIIHISGSKYGVYK